MKEIWVPETIIVVFLALPFFRPFVKAFWSLDGLDWLPLVALGLTVCIFPAYGFRPECLPVLAVAVLINAARFFFSPKDSLRRPSILLPAISLALLVAAAVPMFAFPPKAHPGFREETQAARTLKIRTPGGDFSLMIYEASQTAPLVFIVPPEMGSAASVDLVCRGLLENGFTVITYYRDGPGTSPFAMMRYNRLYKRAADKYAANEEGKSLEAGRRLDVEYLLPRLLSLLDQRGDVPPLLLVGYGAGGSALAYMAGENRLGFLYSNALGVVSVEGRLWSSYLAEARPAPEVPASAGKIRYQWHLLTSSLHSTKPRKVVREGGVLPGAGLPVMYLVSGGALDVPQGQKPYEAVFDAFRDGSGTAVLAAIESAGPLGYQDYPLTHPLYSFLMPGLKGTSAGESPVSDTAAIIGNYAVFLMERAKEAEQERLLAIVRATPPEIFEETAWEESPVETPPTGNKMSIPARQPIASGLYFESRGLPGFRP